MIYMYLYNIYGINIFRREWKFKYRPDRDLLSVYYGESMSWIEEIEYEDAGDELRNIYDQVIEKRGKMSNILKVHSLMPEIMKNHLTLYQSVMFGPSGLSREESELVAVTVSVENHCDYCIKHHLEALFHHWKDRELIRSFLKTDGDADLSERQAGMVDYARKLTRDPGNMDGSDVMALREAGLSELEILSLGLTVSCFNFVNRIALGLGVESTPAEIEGYIY